MQVAEINSWKDFESHLGNVTSKYEHRQLVFRGQVKDHSLIPSIWRGERNPSPSGCIPWLTANWTVCATRLISRFKDTEPSNIETQAVMQHYGYRSFYADVTSNPEVGLWFALHKFRSERTPLYIDSELRSAVFQWSQYIPSSTGFLYIILVPEDESSSPYYDLTDVMPAQAARIHRQKAGAIFCSPGLRSIDKLVVTKLRIVDDGWFKNSSRNLRFTELFPPPSVDSFYSALCAIPYSITLKTEMSKIKLGHPLLGFLPIYAESIRALITEYVPLARILSHARLGIQWNVATGVVDHENQRFKTRGAKRILLSSLMIQSISKEIQVSNTLPTDYWPSRNLVLEFEPEASLVSPSPKAIHEVIRGLWVIMGKKSVFIAEIADTFEDVFLGHECVYSLPGLQLMNKQCDCPNHNYDLELLLKASQLLAKGIVYLEKNDLGYLKLEYKDRD